MKRILIINPLFPDHFVPAIKKQLHKDELVFFENLAEKPFENNIVHRSLNIFYRVVLKNTTYYTKLNSSSREKNLLHSWDKYFSQKFDIALITRADRFPESFIKKIRSQTDYFINYQCDGMSVCEDITATRQYFDKVFTFNYEDITGYPNLEFSFLTNFYFSTDIQAHADTDFYYVGVALPERIAMLQNLIAATAKHSHTFYLSSSADKVLKPFHYMSEPMPYETNIKKVMGCHVLVDLKLPYHNGLSFRFFEALGYGKKIITNNTSIRHYDFYHPDNIFITDFIKFEGLTEWLAKPAATINNDILLKYRFDNWLKQVLSEEVTEPLIAPPKNSPQ